MFIIIVFMVYFSKNNNNIPEIEIILLFFVEKKLKKIHCKWPTSIWNKEKPITTALKGWYKAVYSNNKFVNKLL